MSSFKPTIKWQKWIDPFGVENEEAKWTDYDNDIIDIEKIKQNYLAKLNKQDDEYDDDEDDIPRSDNTPVKVIASPMGLIPYNEHTASGKILNFWVGHTNFTITKNIVDVMENTDGVEILDIFTRYRFRVAIGKCFNDGEVMNKITQNICSHLGDDNVCKE